MGDMKLLDVETHKPQSTDTVVFQDAQEEPKDEVQQGEGMCLE